MSYILHLLFVSNIVFYCFFISSKLTDNKVCTMIQYQLLRKQILPENALW